MHTNLARMKAAVTEWLIKEGLLGDAEFYSINDWRARSETFLNDSVLVLVIDGSPLHTILNYGGDSTEFDDLVESFGFYYGLGHSWNMGFYALPNYDFSPFRGAYRDKLRDERWLRKAAKVKERAGHKCQDCGQSARLEAHHCYYTQMRDGFEPWEYPLSALRALCRECHEERGRTEIRMRAFLANFTRGQLDALREGMDRAFYWFEPDAVAQFLSKIFDEQSVLDASQLIIDGKIDRD